MKKPEREKEYIGAGRSPRLSGLNPEGGGERGGGGEAPPLVHLAHPPAKGTLNRNQRGDI